MPVKKTAAAKKTASKKAAAKKTTGMKGPHTGAVKPRKSAAKKTASAGEGQYTQVAKMVLTALKAGELDFMLVEFDDALTARINKHARAGTNKKTTAKNTDSKKVSAAPKRASASLTLTAGKNYKIGDKPVKLAGAKVQFVKVYTKDKNKAVVKMMVDKPGYPKGKQVVLPKSALASAVR